MMTERLAAFQRSAVFIDEHAPAFR